MDTSNGGAARYSIVRLLGRGGMGEVFLAREHGREHDVALKVLTTATAREIYRFKQEFPSLAGVHTPNLVALRQPVHGLGALHDAGKLHLDIKPSNVLVARDGRVVILDFGLVTDLETAEAHDDDSAL